MKKKDNKKITLIIIAILVVIILLALIISSQTQSSKDQNINVSTQYMTFIYDNDPNCLSEECKKVYTITRTAQLDMCEYLEDQELKNECIKYQDYLVTIKAAVVENNYQLCEDNQFDLRDFEKRACQDYFFYYHATINNKSESCNYIYHNPELKQNCFLETQI